MRSTVLKALVLGGLFSAGAALPLANSAKACSQWCQAIPPTAATPAPPTLQVVASTPPTPVPAPVAALAAPSRIASPPAPRPVHVVATHPWRLECRRSDGSVDMVDSRAPRVNPTEPELVVMRLRHNCTPTQSAAAQAVTERAALTRQQALVALLNASTPAAAERRTAALAALPNAGFTADQTAHIRAALEGTATPDLQLLTARIRLQAIMAERAVAPTS